MGANEGFSYDPFSPEVMRDPHPFYRVLRRDHPAYYAPQYDAFFISRFEDVVDMLSYADNTFVESEGSLPTPAMLRTHNHGVAPVVPAEPFPGGGRLGMPVYGQLRAAHVGPIMPRGLAELEAFIRERAETRLDQLLPQGRFNLTRDYGGFVSSNVMMKLLGVPLERAEEALDAVNSGTRTDPESGGFDSNAVAMQAIDILMPSVEARFAAGADGALPMIDGLIRYRYNGRPLTPQEVAYSSICAFIGGVETVPKITAHGLMELARHPDQLAAVRAGLPGTLPSATEEMIRYCAPAQWFMRTAHKPVTVAGQQIRPGQRAIYLVGAALRDEREFENPDEFHWDRDIKRTVAFGHGVHFCIGFHLARLEIRIMVETFLRRVPEYSFDMAGAERPPSSFQWGWNTLPVLIGPGARLQH